jgi:hypothetical protein
MRTDNERGIALVSVLLVMMMISALLIGFTTMTVSDQRYRFIDRDRNQSFYASAAGLEKLTADLGNLFFTYVAPTPAQIATLTSNPPTIENISYTRADGTSGYQIASQFLGSTTISTGPYQGLYALITRYTMDVTARTQTGGDTHLQRQTETVAIPVFQFGIFSDVNLSFSAADDFDFGGRVHTNGDLFLAQGGASGSTLTLADKVTAVGEIVRQRLSNGVSIDSTGSTRTVRVARAPGVYRTLARTEGSVTDGIGSSLNEPTWTPLSIGTYNGYIRNGRTGARRLDLPLIGLGGANLDLTRRPVQNEHVDNAALYGQRMWPKASLRILLSDTANDITTLPGVTATAPVQLVGGSYSTSSGVQQSTVSANVAAGATNIPVTLNAATNSFKPVLTILGNTVTCTGKTGTSFTGCTGTPAAPDNTAVTSGAAATQLNGAVVAGAKTINVDGTVNFVPQPFWLATVNGASQPANMFVSCTGYEATPAQVSSRFTGCSGVTASVANGSRFTNHHLTAAGTPNIGGFIKIEKQNTAGVWTDVTATILGYGISGPNLGGGQCADPSPNAILRIQRLRDNAKAVGGTCEYAGSPSPSDHWPNVLFDAREALMRDINLHATDVTVGGTMHYIAIDVDNLAEWFAGQGVYGAGVNGTDAITNNGYTVYFSDRRNNRNSFQQETGEYGWEDFVNNGVTNGVPNNILDAGEDLNANTVLDTYGGVPNYGGIYNSVPPGATAPFATTSRPTTFLAPGQAKVNRPMIYRRALKLVNGASIVDSIPGLTIASENPVYIQGNYNANGTFTGAHAATAVIADSATMLSNNWNDNRSFLPSPYNTANRPRSGDTWYRVAIIAGKGAIFNKPTDIAGGSTFGTDGGTHSFLRFLEGDSAGGNNQINYRGSLATFYYNRQAVGPFKCCGGRVYDVPVRDYTFDTDFLNPALLPPNTPMFRDVNTIGFSQEIRPGR